jgi:hypothetical protein
MTSSGMHRSCLSKLVWVLALLETRERLVKRIRMTRVDAKRLLVTPQIPNGKFPPPSGIVYLGEQSMSRYIRLPETITCPMKLSGESFEQLAKVSKQDKVLLSGSTKVILVVLTLLLPLVVLI